MPASLLARDSVENLSSPVRAENRQKQDRQGQHHRCREQSFEPDREFGHGLKARYPHVFCVICSLEREQPTVWWAVLTGSQIENHPSESID